jgi:hypothetical protein
MGGLAGLVMLSWLDAVFVAGALAAAWCLAGGGAKRRAVASAVAFTAAALVVLFTTALCVLFLLTRLASATLMSDQSGGSLTPGRGDEVYRSRPYPDAARQM